MGELYRLYASRRDSFSKLVAANKSAVEEHNSRMLSILLLLGLIIFPILIVATQFANRNKGAILSYALGLAVCIILWVVYKGIPAIRKHVVLGLYACFSLYFLLSIYLSVLFSPDMWATILLCIFCIMPLTFIDKPTRSILFTAFWFMTHTVLAYRLKSQLIAFDDMVNILCFATVGIILGNSMLWTRLQSFDVRRQLVIEKQTDVLTGLNNRLRLFETLEQLKTKEARKPSGIMMLDIDCFKGYNDKHGHLAGDRCLTRFGEVLRTCASAYRLDCFRFGGEEFIVMAYDCSQEELLSIAQALLITARGIDMEGERITISIGVAYCGDEHIGDYEDIINRSDKALYQAKQNGRNRIWMN